MSVLGWSAEQAWDWYRSQPWLVGCNYIPNTAINQLEMWQAETFDPETINRELGWAADRLGFNTVRVFLHDLLWEDDPAGLLSRVDQFLTISQKHAIRPLLVFFDDCWNKDAKLGRQPIPKPGVHNSGWVQSPGTAIVINPGAWDRLETYVQSVLKAFGHDPRILGWDLYNEPGNNDLGERSLPLLEAAFAWARAAEPQQPLTAGTWFDNPVLTEFSLAASDMLTFHNYNATDEELRAQITHLKSLGRPVICTEYMARRVTGGSSFRRYLPIFKEEGVGAINWGLVSGKTQTIYAWNSLPLSKGNETEPNPWFHDIFRADGTPFDPAEVELIHRLTRV